MSNLEPAPLNSSQTNSSGLSFGVWYDYWNTLVDFINSINNRGRLIVHNASAQTIPTATYTKVVLDTKVVDNLVNFDNSTNYRYNPKVAGQYLVSAQVTHTTASSGYGQCQIWKNGAEHAKSIVKLDSTSETTAQLNIIIDMNGTTDYLELYTYQNRGSNNNIVAGVGSTYLNITKI